MSRLPVGANSIAVPSSDSRGASWTWTPVMSTLWMMMWVLTGVGRAREVWAPGSTEPPGMTMMLSRNSSSDPGSPGSATLRSKGMNEATTATRSPATRRPPTARSGERATVACSRSGGTSTRSSVAALSGVTKRDARSCSPGTSSVEVTRPARSSRSATAPAASEFASISFNSTLSRTSSIVEPCSIGCRTTSTPTRVCPSRARFSAPRT